jgi:Phosphodiester glycosidase/FlgD Ig-like domain
MPRRVCLAGLVLALAVFSGAASPATASELVPRVTYQKELRWSSAGPFMLHVVTGPKPQPGGLFVLKPVLAHNRVGGRETVSSMQRRLSKRATVVGVNGDFFGLVTGGPSGLLVRGGKIASSTQGGRSSLGIGADGSLRVDRLRDTNTWTVPGYDTMRLHRINKGVARPGVTLFTPSWGLSTPASKGRVDVVLKGVGPLLPEQQLFPVATRVRRGGGTRIPAGGAVLQAQGADWVGRLVRRARPDRTVVLRIKIRNWWDDVANALGGGPLLVQNGEPVLSAGEDFTRNQLFGRHPRTAVGQLADGRIIFVTVDGRSWFSIGLRISELAKEMARLGAVTAFAFDGGGSSTLAFDGRVLNRPSDGWERPVANALMLLYYGIYAPPPRHAKFSPNGDGVADVQLLRAKIVRPSNVDVTLFQPDGTIAWTYAGSLGASTISKQLTGPTLPEGRWRWVAHALDDRGRESIMDRMFVLNNTLGFLSVSKTRMAVNPKTGGRVLLSVRLAHDARFRFAVRNGRGRDARVLFAGQLTPGTYGVTWNGRNDEGRVVAPGIYTVYAHARNDLGSVALKRKLRVVAE